MNRKMEISYRIREQVFRYISEERLIEKGDTVIAGVSGGADSVCLLFLLSELQDKLNFSLQVLHVEHGIRGETSLRDADFVRNLCKEKGIPCEIRQVNAPEYANEKHLTLEEAARILRYEAFEQAALNVNGPVKIAVAHHKEDQAETVLFQMMRGSGIRGLGGMRSRRGQIIRPLLMCSKQDLYLYIEEKHLQYCTDESNEDDRFARNRIRNMILPALKEMQQGCVDHIAQSAQELQEVEDYIRKQADPVYERYAVSEQGTITIPVPDLLRYDPVIQKAVIRRAIGECIPGKKDVLRRHVESILALCDKEGNGELHLPKGLRVQKREQGLIFTKSDDPEPEGPWLIYEEQPAGFDHETELQIGEDRLLKKRLFPMDSTLAIPQDTYTKWLDYDRIKNGLQIRRRKSGDFISIDDAGHHKSLQDYFVNTKIPAAVRDKILLITSGDHVVWIPGYRISTAFKITEQTKTVMELKITGGLSWETK